MNRELITAFCKVVQSVFDTMVHVPVSFGPPSKLEGLTSRFDVSAVIRLSGSLEGTVVLSLPTKTALAVVSAFVGSRVEAEAPEFTDAVGELANMIAGAAKRELGATNVTIGCPQVIVGADHAVQRPRNGSCTDIPCFSEAGEFAVDICFEDDGRLDRIGVGLVRATGR